MNWKCKLCVNSSATRTKLLEHYRLKHSHYSKVTPLPCLFDTCICTFASFNALKIHLSRVHPHRGCAGVGAQVGLFTCTLCKFSQPLSEEILFSHLRGHLKNHETVSCPFKNCSYTTNVYSSFNAHKSRTHGSDSDFSDDVVSIENDAATADFDEQHSVGQPEDVCAFSEDEECDISLLEAQLHQNLATLFLKMQTVLHVSERACQDIVDHLSEIFLLSEPLLKDAVKDILQKHSVTATEAVLNDLVSSVVDTNVFVRATAKGQDLSSAKRRKTYIEKNYPVVMPVQYVLEPGRTAVYVPILEMIQEIFKHTDVIDRMRETRNSEKGHYNSHKDGSYYQKNVLLCSSELTLPLILYIDDLEIANPLGTSRKIHKLCSVYWVFADLPGKYRSALHVMQLAALCKVTDVQKYGYEKALGPLLKDLCTLEKDGVYIEPLGCTVRGTIFCVVSDNLAAHSLAGFVQCFRVGYICRFCKATHNQIQSLDVFQGEFSPRTKPTHDRDVQDVIQGNLSSPCGVKGVCILQNSLEYFHPTTGFPPDALHDLLEGIVPVELALCIDRMTRLKYFSLDFLNKKIESFPYKGTDATDKPRPIAKTFATKKSIGGNGHENNTLLRLLPLIIGYRVPEGDDAWTILMDLKEIVELVLSPVFDEESIHYLQTKILDHRQLLQEVFPDFKLLPKHHFVEHYPHLIRCFGPLVHLWTMRFEGKHRFFKRVVHHTQNFKNVLKTLATRHQYMLAYYLSAPTFFKPHQQTASVSSVLVSQLPDVAKQHIQQKTDADSIYTTTKISIDGTQYGVGMFVSVGQEGGLPQFSQVENILLVNNNVTFLCNDHTSFYIEHLRSFELLPGNIAVHSIMELNDSVPLNAYSVHGKLLLTPKRFVLPSKH